MSEKMVYKFQCQGSGKCCVSRGNHGFVFLSPSDMKRIEIFLNQDRSTFAQKSQFDYTRFNNGKVKVWHLTNSTDQCRFLKDKRCSIYEARPQQCRTWPYYPENMNPKAWSETAKFCPGIGKGPEVPYAKVQDIVDTQLREDLRYSE